MDVISATWLIRKVSLQNRSQHKEQRSPEAGLAGLTCTRTGENEEEEEPEGQEAGGVLAIG